MTDFKTPERVQCRLQHGHIAVHSKWKNSTAFSNLKGLFTVVKIADIGALDFCLPDTKIVYFSDMQMTKGISYDEISSLPANLIIADRNNRSVAEYSKIQNMVANSGISLLPIGHVGELSLLIHQIHLASTTTSPSVSFEPSTKPPPDIQLRLLLHIPGLGRTNAGKLMQHFGTIQHVGFSSIAELTAVVGRSVAFSVYKFFQEC